MKSISWQLRLLVTEYRIEEKRYKDFKYIRSLAEELGHIAEGLKNSKDVESILLYNSLLLQIMYYNNIAIGMYNDVD